jgi:hypothetical protein
MKRKFHYEQSKKEFGDEFRVVHRFLDQFSDQVGWRHRRILHHTYGVKLVKYFFGKTAAKAAELHIKTDLGYIPEPEDWFKEKKIEDLTELSATQHSKYNCEKCGGQHAITVPPYQRKNPAYKICKCDD